MSTMNDLTLDQVLNLRPVQDSLIANRENYIKNYRKFVKQAYTAELKNLMQSEFDRNDVKLKIPELPSLNYQPQEYKSMLSMDKLIEYYDATIEGFSLL
ncbi:uncharacterized protein LOC115621489 [Scaptodrosophila lebanonensis]|uniref:Uncharacterized protein LOC115621489 n=1 Tax=Drosophila lebanonensis TaxID=7225 RepID=A0A6J2T285_DROLE|nr:uncharacterized protein LOC115621489 [Scaptodrosophila lebanonensis]